MSDQRPLRRIIKASGAAIAIALLFSSCGSNVAISKSSSDSLVWRAWRGSSVPVEAHVAIGNSKIARLPYISSQVAQVGSNWFQLIGSSAPMRVALVRYTTSGKILMVRRLEGSFDTRCFPGFVSEHSLLIECQSNPSVVALLSTNGFVIWRTKLPGGTSMLDAGILEPNGESSMTRWSTSNSGNELEIYGFIISLQGYLISSSHKFIELPAAVIPSIVGGDKSNVIQIRSKFLLFAGFDAANNCLITIGITNFLLTWRNENSRMCSSEFYYIGGATQVSFGTAIAANGAFVHGIEVVSDRGKVRWTWILHDAESIGYGYPDQLISNLTDRLFLAGIGMAGLVHRVDNRSKLKESTFVIGLNTSTGVVNSVSTIDSILRYHDRTALLTPIGMSDSPNLEVVDLVWNTIWPKKYRNNPFSVILSLANRSLKLDVTPNR